MPRPPFFDDPIDEDFDPESQWVEESESPKPGGGGSFSWGQASDALSCSIYDSLRLPFIRNVCGFAWTNNSQRMFRQPPLRHPYYEWLYATGVDFHRDVPAGNPDPPINSRFAHYLTKNPTGSVPKHSYYEHCMATVKFEPIPYPALTDGEVYETETVAPESLRYVDYHHDTAPEISQISAKVGRVLKFAEGPANNPKGKEFPSEIFEYLCKTAISWKWYFVPHEFLFRTGDIVPRFVPECLGRVNSSAFKGGPAGVFLLLGAKLEKFQWPWMWPGLNAGELYPAYGYHVTLVVSHFDPTPAVETAGGTPLARGHNLLPWSPKVASHDTVWYLATRGGGETDPRLIPGVDFRRIFLHADA